MTVQERNRKLYEGNRNRRRRSISCRTNIVRKIMHKTKTNLQKLYKGDIDMAELKAKSTELFLRLAFHRHTWKVLLVLPVVLIICFMTTAEVKHNRSRRHLRSEQKEYLLIMCTTLIPSRERDLVHKNTMLNWKKLGEDILPVLFLDDKYKQTKQTFVEHGWVVLPIESTSYEGNPVIKDFFLTIRNRYRTRYMGYANSDILFNNELPATLKLMDKYRPYIEHPHEILITGSRYDVENITTLDFSSSEKIRTIQNQFSTRHSPMGQDYFITDVLYPWETLTNIVAGKQRIDNWILIHAIEFNFTAIDSSVAIAAIHQTVDKGSWVPEKWNFSLNNPKYNEQLIQDVQQDFVYFQTGNLDCLPYELNYTVAKELVLIERPRVADFCKRQVEVVEMLRLRKEKMDRKIKLIELKNKKLEEQKKLNKKLEELKKKNAAKSKEYKRVLEDLKKSRNEKIQAARKLAVYDKYYLKPLKKDKT